MYILGLDCYYHDAAAALIKDGKLIAAAEERFTRKKHDIVGCSRAKCDFSSFYLRPSLTVITPALFFGK